jgi:hypothetical protein
MCSYCATIILIYFRRRPNCREGGAAEKMLYLFRPVVGLTAVVLTIIHAPHGSFLGKSLFWASIFPSPERHRAGWSKGAAFRFCDRAGRVGFTVAARRNGKSNCKND